MPSSVSETLPLRSCLKLIGSVAHTAAYDKTRILHRDVSAGNILITDKGGGILIDWDLSKKVKEYVDPKPRQHSRTVRYRIRSHLSYGEVNPFSGNMAIHICSAFAGSLVDTTPNIR